MSYDLYLFIPQPGTDLLEQAHARLEAEEQETSINPGPQEPETEARKQAIADALRAANPALQPFAFGYAEIARSQGITEEQARNEYRHIELNGPEDGNGIQITLFDSTVSVTIPYWHTGKAAEQAWSEIWSYLEILEHSWGFRAFDGQIDQVIDRGRDFDLVLSTYLEVASDTQRIVSSEPEPQEKPWWKLWS